MEVNDCDLFDEVNGKSIDRVEVHGDGMHIQLNDGKSLVIIPSREYRVLLVYVVDPEPMTLQ